MSKQQVSDFIQSGMGFSIVGEEPEFNEEGELVGYSLSAGTDSDMECPTFADVGEALALLGMELPLDDWRDTVREAIWRLENVRGPGVRSARSVLWDALRAGRLTEGDEYQSRWFLPEVEGITQPEAEQSDDAGYWQMEEHDPLWSLHHEAPAWGLWNHDGSKRLGSEETRYLASKATEREIRAERMLAYLAKVPVQSLVKVRSRLMDKYVSNVKECSKRNCWHGLLLTRAQKDACLDLIRRRISSGR